MSEQSQKFENYVSETSDQFYYRIKISLKWILLKFWF